MARAIGRTGSSSSNASLGGGPLFGDSKTEQWVTPRAMRSVDGYQHISFSWTIELINVGIIVFFSLSCKDAGTNQPHIPTRIEVNIDPTSIWSVESSRDQIVLWEKSGDMKIRIDYTGPGSDGSVAGIYVEKGSVRFEGVYAGSRVACFIPDIALTQDEICLFSNDSVLKIMMKGQTYKDIKQTGVDSLDNLPITMTAMIKPTTQGFTMSLDGMYYILLPKDRTAVRITFGQLAHRDSVFVDQKSARLIKYFDDAYSADITNEMFGDWTIVTDARRLQIDVPDPSLPTFTMFELDFDHSYKDHGQMSVSSVVNVILDRQVTSN